MAKCEIMNRDEVEEIVYNNDSFSNIVGEVEEVEFIDGSFGTIRWLDSDGEEIEVCGYEHKKPIHRIVVKEGKSMKKNRMTERFTAPKDWDFDKMIEDYGFEYLSEKDPDSEPYSMGEFNELTDYADDPLEAITRAFYGGRYGFKNDSFNPNDEYFAYDGYGNLISIKDYDINDYLKDHIDESYFYDWCVEEGYFESDEDDE